MNYIIIIFFLRFYKLITNMKDIIIIGAGGIGREVIFIIEEINKQTPTLNILGFIDDNIFHVSYIHF